MKVAIRLDDITPDMNWEHFHKMRNILFQARLAPLIGVVPNNQDEMLHFSDAADDFYNQLKDLKQQGWLIAQHGCNHIYTTKKKGMLHLNAFSEFAGEPFLVQKERILTGKNILKQHGIETDIFMAPGHSYDNNTILALKECGFLYVTDGYYKVPYVQKGITFIPQRAGELQKAGGIDTVCVHTNLMEEKDFAAFEEFIRKYRDNFVDFSVLMQEKAVKKGIRVSLAERITIEKRLFLRKIGSSKRAEKYFKLCQAKHAVFSRIKKIVFFPYLAFLICTEKNTDMEEQHE